MQNKTCTFMQQSAEMFFFLQKIVIGVNKKTSGLADLFTIGSDSGL